ncbi:MAG: ShlB/FhaC/HecB family hemolysin secretion/activation protein [Kovacikia sp.]
MRIVWVQPFWCLLNISLMLGVSVTISCDRVLAQIPEPIRPQEQPFPFPLPPKPPVPIPIPQPALEPPLQLPTPTVPSPKERLGIPGTITVTRFEFAGNTAFSDEKLTQVTAPFTNRPITFAEMLQAEAAVTKLYTDEGYINSGAVIPAEQTFPREGAVVKIQVIEGGVEEIRVTVDGRLNPDYVRSRLALATDRPLNQNRLLEALQVLQLNPLIQNISADLSAGSRPQLSVLSVNVKEAVTSNVELFADNGRVKSIGSFERGVRFNQGNLSGFGDGLNVEYANTDGSNAVYANYTIPINPYNGTIKLSGQFNNTQVVEAPFNQLDITGDSRYYDLTFRQPVKQTPAQELALGLTAAHEESKTTLLGVGFPLSPGANNEGQTEVSALRFFQDWTQRSSQDVLALRSQFSLGLGGSGATTPNGQFFDWLGQGQYVRLLAPDTLLVLRSSFQLSTNPLVPLEQFALGGLYSVRGYRQDLLLTDNGVFASAEVRLPILRVDSVKGLLQVAPFLDFGVGWNDDRNPIPTPNPNTLVSLGLGLQWQMGDNFNARLDWGIPLTQFEVGGRTLEQQGLYFTLNYRLN